ncbi:hypothetical protein [Prolixibacter sp. SD074]|uniref:hypothetical protein n=1 Tax=Prolixibacter sp. SD074 TaxID=2652391 RepID=UPI001298F833|nr:hypothetical protein [Prolixibacter sp. SD074]
MKELITLKNALLIGGCGRDVGKTSAGCTLVKELSLKTPVYVVKISSHFHVLTDSLNVLASEDKLMIAEETGALSGKDSSRYLAAGASKVYYVQAREESLPVLVKWLAEKFNADQPVIIESGGLGRYIRPGAAALICNGNSDKKVDWPFNYQRITENEPSEVRIPFKWNVNRWQKR